jgi:hypothetical protein
MNDIAGPTEGGFPQALFPSIVVYVELIVLFACGFWRSLVEAESEAQACSRSVVSFVCTRPFASRPCSVMALR